MRVSTIATIGALLVTGCRWGYELLADSGGSPSGVNGGAGGAVEPGTGGSANASGGAMSAGGAPGTCSRPEDCTSGVCTGNLCQNPTCMDGVKNQDETDIDCGGTCGATCEEGESCSVDGDCIKNSCAGSMCDICPGDDDVDNDGVCDTEDFETRGLIVGATRPSVSPDGATLFALSSDLLELRAYDVQATPSTAPTLIDSVTIAAGTRIFVEVFALDATRAAVTIQDTFTSDIQWIQVYELQGSTLTLVEDIDTTSNRIYAIHYDSATDQMYWSSFMTPPVYSYELGTTPLGYTGLGSSVLPFTQVGAFGMHFEGDRLFKVTSYVEIGDLSTGNVITSWPLGAGVGGSIGQNTVSVVSGTLLLTTLFGFDTRFIMEDVSALPTHTEIANVQLASTALIIARFVVRGPRPVALVSTDGQPLRVFDLATLPEAPPAPRELPATVLEGNASLGFLDCNDSACFVAANTGIYVLAP